MLIPLKAKYRSAHKGTHKGGERAATLKHRKKIGYTKHVALYGVPVPRTLRVEGRSGKGRFEVAS